VRGREKMAAGSEVRKLPPVLAYPFIATNILLLVTILMELSHQFQGWWMTLIGSSCSSCLRGKI
jgi:hypothetical protein